MAAVTTVPATADLQAYLDSAQPGDTLVLTAGATYTGNFILPVKPLKTGTDADYITVRSSALPHLVSGKRVAPSNASSMAKIVDPGNGLPAFLAPLYSHYWKLEGLEILPATPSTQIYDLVIVGSFGTDQNTLDRVPHHFVFDRCYIHGWPNANFKRGIALNGAYLNVTNSYISEFHSDFQESQALAGGNGPGPFQIVNNYLEGAAENILFASGPSIPGLVPGNIQILRNYFYKPLSLKTGGAGYTPWIKNFIEFKNGQDIVIDGNLMENNWVQAPAGQTQHGSAIVLTPRTDYGYDTSVVVQRVQITNNVIRHVGGVIAIGGLDDGVPQTVRTNNVVLRNNLVDDIRNDYSFIGSLAIEVLGSSNVTIDHNDLFYRDRISYLVTIPPDSSFVFTNNIFPFGVGLNSPCGWKADALACAFPGGLISRNLAVGAIADWMPADTFEPATMDLVGFLSFANGPANYHNYALATTSVYKNAATDGTDVGVSIVAIDRAIGTTSLK